MTQALASVSDHHARAHPASLEAKWAVRSHTLNGIYYPDEVNEMREELTRGEFPGETAKEREIRAQDIVERRRFRKQTDLTGEPAARPTR